jgi:hypothetical protein
MQIFVFLPEQILKSERAAQEFSEDAPGGTGAPRRSLAYSKTGVQLTGGDVSTNASGRAG